MDMVNKKTLALLGGLGILAYAYLSRPRRTSTIIKTLEPLPVPIEVPYPEPVPFLDTNAAKDFLVSQYGTLYKQSGTVTNLTSGSKAALQEFVDNFNARFRTYANTGRKNPSQVGIGWAIQQADNYNLRDKIAYESSPTFEAI
tara:strand:+ start:428 stop:856 length:429 start_codon:yes stop_codon:yes gene_type:complete